MTSEKLIDLKLEIDQQMRTVETGDILNVS